MSPANINESLFLLSSTTSDFCSEIFDVVEQPMKKIKIV